jgi:hypothetical protein
VLPPLPRAGEGWGEGTTPRAVPFSAPPHPDPLPEGEGTVTGALQRLPNLIVKVH